MNDLNKTDEPAYFTLCKGAMDGLRALRADCGLPDELPVELGGDNGAALKPIAIELAGIKQG